MEELILLGESFQLDRFALYFIYQCEITPSTGRPHLQGYIYFANGKSLRSVKKLLVDSAHVEIARGTAKQNRTYCSKADSRAEGTEPREWGEAPEHGRRTDLEEAVSAFCGGLSKSEMAEQFPATVARYGRGLERCREWADSGLRRSGPVDCKLFWGPPGTGKTRWAYDTFGEDHVYRVVDTGSRFWWDGYDPRNHKCVIFDDIDGSHSLNLILQWIDRYPVRGEIKGGTVGLVFESAVFTTNIHPSSLWAGRPKGNIDAFFRRCTSCTEVGGGNTMPPPYSEDDLAAILDELL